MWSHLPLGGVLASFFLCSGCLVAAWLRLKRSRAELERLGQEFDLRNREHDDAYLRLEGRVDDLAARLVRSAAERRQLAATNQRLEAENRALAGSLSAAGEVPAMHADAPAAASPETASRMFAAYEAFDTEGPETAVFEQMLETVLALAREPEPEPPACAPEPSYTPDSPEPETVQGVEAMPQWNENQGRPSIRQPAPFPSGSSGGAGPVSHDEVGSAARVRELERELSARDEHWQRQFAAVESLRDATAHQGSQVEAVARRCADLELVIQRLIERISERPEPPAPVAEEPPVRGPSTRETELDARVQELEQRIVQQAREEHERLCHEHELYQASMTRANALEADLAKSAESLQRRSAEHEAVQAELASSLRRVDGAERLLEELQQRIAQQSQESEEEREHLRLEEELHQSAAVRASELAARLAAREEELARATSNLEAVQSEWTTSRRKVDAAERLLEELQQRIAQQSQQSDADQERLRREQDLHQTALALASELESRLTGREEDLRQRAGTIELLQGEVAAKNRQIESIESRCADLEQRLQSQAQEETARLRREQEIHHGWTARTAELEGHLARRDEDLRQRGVIVERLERDVSAKDRQVESANGRCAELEQELRRREEREEERLRHEQSLQQTLSSRASELEVRVASLGEDLRQRSAAIEALERELDTKGRELDAKGRELDTKGRELDANGRELEAKSTRAEEALQRCAELEREMQQRAEKDQVRRAQERGLEDERVARIAALERDVANRDEDIRRFRDEQAHLTDRCQGLSERLDARARDLRLQEQHMAEVQTRAEGSEATARRRAEDVQAGDSLVDELVDNRLVALFKRRATQSSEPFSELYLDGLEQGDFDLAMQSLLGDPEPIAAASVSRLGTRWRRELEAWRAAPLEREVVYLWADGVRLRAGLGEPEAALLVVVASHADGSRSVVAVETGDSSSKDAWLSVLRSLVQRGMNVPRLVVGSGASGLWAGIDELGWECARQYCWSRETDAVLAGLPKKRRSQAEKILRAAASAETRAAAKKLRDRFVKRCGVRCAASGERLTEDWKALTAFYGFPEDHWPHLQTTEVVESPISSIRLASVEPKSGKPSPNVEPVLWKLLSAAARGLKKLSAPQLLPPVAGPGAEPVKAAKGRSRTKAA